MYAITYICHVLKWPRVNSIVCWQLIRKIYEIVIANNTEMHNIKMRNVHERNEGKKELKNNSLLKEKCVTLLHGT